MASLRPAEVQLPFRCLENPGPALNENTLCLSGSTSQKHHFNPRNQKSFGFGGQRHTLTESSRAELVPLPRTAILPRVAAESEFVVLRRIVADTVSALAKSSSLAYPTEIHRKRRQARASGRSLLALILAVKKV